MPVYKNPFRDSITKTITLDIRDLNSSIQKKLDEKYNTNGRPPKVKWNIYDIGWSHVDWNQRNYLQQYIDQDYKIIFEHNSKIMLMYFPSK